MVTHYDRGECDCPHCGRLCSDKEMVQVTWSIYAACKYCKEKYKEKEVDSKEKPLES